jgi:hypothetical protein
MLPDHPKRRSSSRPVQQKPVCLSSTGTSTRIPFLYLDVIPGEVGLTALSMCDSIRPLKSWLNGSLVIQEQVDDATG